MTREEAKVVLREHERFMHCEGEYYFTTIPPYSIEEVNQAKTILQNETDITTTGSGCRQTAE